MIDNTQPMQEVVAEVQMSFNVPDIAVSDSLAVAGYKALRHHYTLIGGRDVWTLTSLGDATFARIAQLDRAVRHMRNDGRVFERGFRPKVLRHIVRHIRDLCAQLGRARQSLSQLSILEDYIQRCDEDARVGLMPLMQVWQAQADEHRVELIASLNDDPHQDWLESMGALLGAGDADLSDGARPIEPGKPSHVRHVIHAAIEARLRDVRAYDTLLDIPVPDQIDGLRRAIERLSYTAEAFASVLPNEQFAHVMTASHAALDVFTPLCTAHTAAQNARSLAATLRIASNGPQTFAEAQTRVVEARLPEWRGFLQPFL